MTDDLAATEEAIGLLSNIPIGKRGRSSYVAQFSLFQSTPFQLSGASSPRCYLPQESPLGPHTSFSKGGVVGIFVPYLN